MKNFWIVGITGRTGSGKSMVRAYYQSLGYPVVDADAVSRAVCAPGMPCVEALAKAFGKDIVAPDGALDRKKLAELAFMREGGSDVLVSITHPYIIGDILRQAEAAKQAGHKLFFADGAVIVGAPFQQYCDKLIVVTADAKVSISRVILRDGISKTSVQRRLAAQLSEAELRAAADYVIENNGTQAALQKRAQAVLGALLEDFEKQVEVGI